MAGASSWKGRDIGTHHNKTDPSNEPINGENETKEHLKKDKETQVKPVKKINSVGKRTKEGSKTENPKGDANIQKE